MVVVLEYTVMLLVELITEDGECITTCPSPPSVYMLLSPPLLLLLLPPLLNCYFYVTPYPSFLPLPKKKHHLVAG